MARNKPTRKSTDARPAATTGVHPQWIWVALGAGLIFGGAFGFFAGQAVGQDGAQVDRYGRPPSHAHYNHDHP